MISLSNLWGRRWRNATPSAVPPLSIPPSADQRVGLEQRHCQPPRKYEIAGYRCLLPTIMVLGTAIASVLMPMAAHGTAPVHGPESVHGTESIYDTESDELRPWPNHQGNAPEEHAHRCTVPLTTAIAPIIDQPTFAEGNWGIVVASLETGEWLYRHNENQYFVPASNIKLLTTAAALSSLEFPTSDLLSAFYDWVGVTNRASNNQYAEALLRRVGGPETIKSTLELLGINPNDYRQVDGSGLSRYNMAKPTVFIDILVAMTNISRGTVFYNSLPVAGQSGTLRNRFKNTSAQGIVRAKTGTLRGVRALSGYMAHPTEGTLVFSILVNQPGQSGGVMVNAIDEMVVAIAQTTNCQ